MNTISIFKKLKQGCRVALHEGREVYDLEWRHMWLYFHFYWGVKQEHMSEVQLKNWLERQKKKGVTEFELSAPKRRFYGDVKLVVTPEGKEHLRNKITLLTTIYPIQSPDRLAEIKYCMEQNAASEFIGRIVFFAEKFEKQEFDDAYAFLRHPKVEVLHIPQRPTYRRFFEYANEHLAKRLVVIANSDVCFDDTLVHVEKFTKGQFWCLSRHNYDRLGTLRLQPWATGSADAWFFYAPIKLQNDDVLIGIIGCDPHIAVMAKQAGYSVRNPSLTIMLRHIHQDKERNSLIGGLHRYPYIKGYEVEPCHL